jgi:hypothetical protein
VLTWELDRKEGQIVLRREKTEVEGLTSYPGTILTVTRRIDDGKRAGGDWAWCFPVVHFHFDVMVAAAWGSLHIPRGMPRPAFRGRLQSLSSIEEGKLASDLNAEKWRWDR